MLRLSVRLQGARSARHRPRRYLRPALSLRASPSGPAAAARPANTEHDHEAYEFRNARRRSGVAPPSEAVKCTATRLASARPVRAALDSLGQLRSCIDQDPAGAGLKNGIEDSERVAGRGRARAASRCRDGAVSVNR
jgi:hypothetical protein